MSPKQALAIVYWMAEENLRSVKKRSFLDKVFNRKQTEPIRLKEDALRIVSSYVERCSNLPLTDRADYKKLYEKFNGGDVVIHLNGEIPNNYICYDCGIRGVKLYKEYQTIIVTDDVVLRCKKCALKNQRKEEHDLINESEIGFLISAIPTPDNSTFYSYSAATEDANEWWQKLPANLSPGD